MRECEYCRNDNPDTEHRCQRCGRRLPDTDFPSARYIPVPVTSRGSAAPALQPVAQVARPSLPASGLPANRPVQKPLFGGPVMRIEDYDPSVRQRRTRSRPARRQASRRRASPDQQSFEFLAPASEAQTVAMAAPIAAEPARCCDQPVASLSERLAAAGVDMAIALLAMFPALAVPFYWAEGLGLAAPTFGLLAGSYAVVLILYKFLWCIGNGDSLGAAWRGLRLLDFDGRPATREQRMRRLAAEVLSTAALGLGVFWALGDRERLSWHDHISRTFLAPRP